MSGKRAKALRKELHKSIHGLTQEATLDVVNDIEKRKFRWKLVAIFEFILLMILLYLSFYSIKVW